MVLEKIAVFAGSQDGNNKDYIEKVQRLGTLLGKNKQTLIYGGGNRGLMGKIAAAVKEAGGQVHEITTEEYADLDDHSLADKVTITKNKNQRKQAMFLEANAAIVLPGSLDTIDEFFSFLCSTFSLKPRPLVGMLNINGIFDGIISFINKSVAEGFGSTKYPMPRNLIIDDDPEKLLQALNAADKPKVQTINLEPDILNAAQQALIETNKIQPSSTARFTCTIGGEEYSFEISENGYGGYNFRMQNHAHRFSKSDPNLRLTNPKLEANKESNEATFARYIRCFLGLTNNYNP